MVIALIGLSAVCGCAKPPRAAKSLSDEQIIKALRGRLDAQDGPPNARREIGLIVRRSVGGEDIACGLSGFPEARASNGDPMFSGFVAAFVVRNQRLFVEQEMTPAEFDRLQDQLCGPDWVKPQPSLPGVP